MKRIVSLILCLAVILGLCACGDNNYDGTGLPDSKFISSESNKEFKYDVYEDYVIITEYFGEDFRVTIPSRLSGKPVKGIGDNAIGKSMLAIDIVDVPKSVVYIEPSAFFGCTTTTIYTVAEGNPVYKSEKGIIYSKDGKQLLHYPSGVLEEKISVKAGVETIGGYAFANNEDVVNISLPSSVKEIKAHSFDGCTKLNSVNLPEGITAIEDYAFYECEALAKVEFPSTLISIGEHSFDYCVSIKEIDVPDSVVSIGDCAFLRCKSLNTVELSVSLKKYGYKVFTGCSTLKEFKIASGNNFFRVADGVIYSADGSELVDYPYGKINERVKIIDGVKSIRAYAFYFDDNNDVSYPDDTIQEIDFNNVEKINAYAFANRFKIGAVELPETLTEISSTAFNNCLSISAYRMKDNEHFVSDGGVLFTADKKTLVAYPADKTQTAYTIPEGIENIGEYAFSDCVYLTDITFPSTLKTVGNYGFYKSALITSVELPASLKSIGEFSFANCIMLETVKIPDNTITEIPRSAFDCCDGIYDFIVPYGVTSIGEDAFRECAYIVYVELPSTLKKIDNHAFYDMDNLHDLVIPPSVTEFGEEIVTIEDESNLDKVVLYVQSGSKAESYAIENNISYEIEN